MRRKFTMEELENDPAAAASFLAAFIRQQYGWDEPGDRIAIDEHGEPSRYREGYISHLGQTTKRR